TTPCWKQCSRTAGTTRCCALPPISHCPPAPSRPARFRSGKKSRRRWTGDRRFFFCFETSLTDPQIFQRAEAHDSFRNARAKTLGKPLGDILPRREIHDVLCLDDLARHVLETAQR